MMSLSMIFLAPAMLAIAGNLPGSPFILGNFLMGAAFYSFFW